MLFRRAFNTTCRTVRSRSAQAGLVVGLTSFWLTSCRSVHLDAPPDKKPRGANLDDEQRAVVDHRLRQYEKTVWPQSGSGVSRYDVVQVASNQPIEDAHCEAVLPIPSGFWSLFAVLDGHNGPQTSAWLKERIISAVVGAVGDVYTKFASSSGSEPEKEQRPEPPPESIDGAIKDTFKRLDDEIVHEAVEKVFSTSSRASAIKLLATAHAGSCALLALYDSQDKSLRVALTGDSRAVLGRRVPSPVKEEGADHGDDESHERQSYEVHVLSVDQNANNPAEEARMNALHPGETIMEKGRVLGWGMSRAFGDAAYKWSLDIQERLHKEYLGDRPRPNVKTPPYFTAEPEVTTIKVQPGDFLIMATDGLWDCLTNEEAVGLVGMWLNDRGFQTAPDEHPESQVVVRKTTKPKQLPIIMAEDRTTMYPYWRTKKKFANVDANAATHLTRNALGGADSDLTAGLLSMTLPRSRRFRDDITAIVVFFDNDLH